MSTNGDAEPSRNQSQVSTPALDVPFSTIADRHGEASSSRHNSKAASKSPRRSTSHHRTSHSNGASAGAVDPQKDKHKNQKDKHRHHEKVDGNEDTPHSKKLRHGFLLGSLRSSGGRNKDSSPPSEKSTGKKRQHDVEATPEQRRSTAYSRQSNDASSLGSSPLSREVRSDGSWGGQTQAEQPPAASPAMNPAQLVQMALSLSESRKRHVSNSLRIPVPNNGLERRVVSATPALGTVRGRTAGRQHAAVTGDDGRVSTSSRRNVSPPLPHDASDPYVEDFEVGEGTTAYNFSPATLSRAEKARRYFELASEHRRMLKCLPPLEPEIPPVGHHRSRSLRASITGRPDSVQDAAGHTNGASSGRQYNPLQALRNRDVRQRERKPLTLPIDNWQDTDAVKAYVDSVEEEFESAFSTGPADRGVLPLFAGDGAGKAATQETDAGRARGNTTNSVLTKPENQWFIEPAELLADTYWTERNGNKHFIENRRSQRIFPKQYQTRQSVDRARLSHDMLRHSNDFSQFTDDASDLPNSENEASAADSSKKHRRHKLRLSIHGIDHVRKKRLTRMRAASDSSISSVDSHQLRNLQHGGDFTNTGPLEKHMAQMIEQDERGHVSSPDLVSPDHWDSRNTQFPVMRSRADSVNKRATTSHQHPQINGSLAPHDNMEQLGHRRSKSADGRLHGSLNAPLSIDYESSVEPNSPMVQSHVPSFVMDAPAKKDNKRISKLKKHFRSDSKERNHVDHMDFAEAPGASQQKDNESDHTNGTQTPPRFSFDALRPLPVQRQKTSDSLTNSLRPTTTRESSSTVGRMFKNARLSGLVRTESRFRYKDKFGDVGSATDLGNVSDVERIPSGEGKEFRRRSGSTASDGMSPRQSFEDENRPKLFNQNMPKFVSAVRGRGKDAAKSSTGSGGSSQQHSRTHSQLRSEEKADRPRIVLPDDVNRSQTSLATSHRGGRPYGSSTARSSRVSLGETSAMERMRGKGGRLDSHRNWSISHPNTRLHDGKSHNGQPSRISHRDIVRCRALILASGIKAREIKRIADCPRAENDTSRSDLQLAFSVTGTSTPPGPIARKDEALTAGKLISSSLGMTLQHLDTSLRTFHSTTCPALVSEMQELKHIASDQLTNACHDASDEADAFTAQLATEFTMDVKNVEDSVEAMVRRRNRNFRVLRRIGFKGLEWTVLALMWAIWFVVVVFNAGRSIVMTVVGLFKWLLWF
ncbi:hypothetical protein K431DRAFT_284522 [Polychaeton citri CBS 116435]|uniref:Uncharacterized protein n=1 Tax=Polychaeton citri CBS 116435 TaxID=1314669 RepID=A0A9P4Q8N9_9PEZI|nr:hypothetical protein K431DRAFT_284522 [Polychaeton citri CBS 116435]